MLMSLALTTTNDGSNVFYWRKDQIPDEYAVYRTEDTIGSKRSMDEISSYEIANAIREVLEEQISLLRKDLIKETAKKFGYTRLGAVIENTIDYAIDRAKDRELISEDDSGKFILIG